MDNPLASSSRLPISTLAQEEYEATRLTFQPASQAQIIRAHQRDSAQILRLIELVSEFLRSIAGTRWLAHKQTIIDLLVKAIYLSLTFGRGSQTLGEEYTDIIPYSNRRARRPSRSRRVLTILFLLFPSVLTSPSTINYLRSTTQANYNHNLDNSQTITTRVRARTRNVKMKLLQLLDSPIGKALPELHMIAFLFSGRFFDFARRLTGLTYISTLPAKPPEQATPSYEPLGLLMLLPFIYRLLSRRITSTSNSESTSLANGMIPPQEDIAENQKFPLSSTTAEQTLLLSKNDAYDTPNTYLTTESQQLAERQCTLCLEPRGTGEGSGGTVAVTECGHVFCWGCLGGLEKLECPLCRQGLRMERLVAAYNI